MSMLPRRTEQRAIAPWLAIGLLILLLMGLMGCGSTGSQDGIQHLTLWHGVNPPENRQVLQRLVDRFNADHPEIQVEPLYIGQGDQQMPKILAAIVGNAPPSMLWYAPMITGQLVELNAIRPLDDWLDATPVYAQLDPALIATMTLEGQRWSVPFGFNTVGLFYRPSLFAAAGIDALPHTWEELRQVAAQLTQRDGDRLRRGMLLPLGKGEWTVFTWLPFLWSADGVWGTPETETGANPHPGAIAALQFWRDLITDGSAQLSQPERGYELDDFLAGNVAMQLTGPWTLGALQSTDIDFGVMPIPSASHPATSIGGENLFIFRTTPAQEQAAFTFAEYVLSEPFQTQWAMETGYLPVNLRSRQNPDYQAFVADHPEIQVFLEQARYGRSRPLQPGYSRRSEALGRAIESVLLGKQSPEAALKTAQTRLELSLYVSKPKDRENP